MKKMLTIGDGYSTPPQDMTGAVAVTKESLDSNVKNITWGSKDYKRLKNIKRKKRKKKLVKAILIIKNKYPQVPLKEIVELFKQRLEYKIEKANNPNKIDKVLLKAIIQSVRQSYPNLDTESIVKISEEVYKKKL